MTEQKRVYWDACAWLGLIKGETDKLSDLEDVCRDSGFQLSMDRAAHFAGNLLGIGAIGIWTAFGDLTNMTSIAAGTNPALKLPRYGGPTRLNATDTKEECE